MDKRKLDKLLLFGIGFVVSLSLALIIGALMRA